MTGSSPPADAVHVWVYGDKIRLKRTKKKKTKHATNFLDSKLPFLLLEKKRHPQPHHTGMSYSKQHYILQEQEIYTNTGQHGNLLHSESQAEAEGV